VGGGTHWGRIRKWIQGGTIPWGEMGISRQPGIGEKRWGTGMIVGTPPDQPTKYGGDLLESEISSRRSKLNGLNRFGSGYTQPTCGYTWALIGSRGL
jgi:hypothetical protein